MSKETGFITLKEASEISGYAPDYVGQLIRKGKLPGKQVYHAVAWMTTEKAVRDYVAKSQSQKDGGTHIGENMADAFRRFLNTLRTEAGLVKIFRILLYGFLAMLAIFMVLLFYVFSVNLDKRLQEKALEKTQQEISNN